MDENTDSNYVRDSTVIDDTIYGLINEAFEMERKTNDIQNIETPSSRKTWSTL